MAEGRVRRLFKWIKPRQLEVAVVKTLTRITALVRQVVTMRWVRVLARVLSPSSFELHNDG